MTRNLRSKLEVDWGGPDDTDGDGVPDDWDACPAGGGDWTSNYDNDADSDGCNDSTEDDYVSPCDPGHWGATSDDCAEADPGYYVPIGGSADQQLCENGTYQPSSGQTSCIEAAPGHYVPVPLTWTEEQTSFGTTISTGNTHTCGIVESGDAYCWGSGGEGKLGNGATSDSDSPTKVSLPTGRTAKSISAGADHTCAILDDGYVYCWGINWEGQLGNSSICNSCYSSIPVRISLPATARYIAAGNVHTCAIWESGDPASSSTENGPGTVSCWGDGGDGRLGGGSNSMSNSPVPV